MPVQVRFYDSEGDGYWFKVEPVEKSETETEAVVSLTHSEADYASVWLSADDVEKLIEELQQYRKPKAIANPTDPWKTQIFRYNINNKNIDLSDPYPG